MTKVRVGGKEGPGGKPARERECHFLSDLFVPLPEKVSLPIFTKIFQYSPPISKTSILSSIFCKNRAFHTLSLHFIPFLFTFYSRYGIICLLQQFQKYDIINESEEIKWV